MPEHRVESYVRLAEELAIPICSPEIAEGGRSREVLSDRFSPDSEDER